MKTTKTKTTTVDPFYYDETSFFHFDESNMYDLDFATNDFFENMLFYEKVLHTIHVTYDIVSCISFFINLFHLFVLTRKELRSNLVYMVMIGVCLCDFVQSLGTIVLCTMTWGIVYSIEPCYDGTKYYHAIVDVLAETSQIFGRRCSSFLALYIAAIRALSVMFPMSNTIAGLMTPKYGFLIQAILGIVCAAWSSVFFFKTKIEKIIYCDVLQKTPSYVPYHYISGEKWEMQYIMFDGYMAISVSVLYILVAAALVGAILKAERIRRNVSGDQFTNTYKLVIVMAVSVFISEATYGGLYYFNYHIFQGYDEQ
ncbi:hypothetical protein GCK72_020631 [Caenorhabditis remanei]|uniref:G-protein coupled receptors family 1 profile domain-containing protein n=1 Tax=Caenorhabditis remanei TaxID=31234 RepID=A0A6A5GHB3_CAERE|nr:hypothetical protein GCK72_020631 [Caenorhabditis remanei]KAF1754073.1 hypothetical protein GCK72_020631 [Caenorhabditis remanei]